MLKFVEQGLESLGRVLLNFITLGLSRRNASLGLFRGFWRRKRAGYQLMHFGLTHFSFDFGLDTKTKLKLVPHREINLFCGVEVLSVSKNTFGFISELRSGIE